MTNITSCPECGCCVDLDQMKRIKDQDLGLRDGIKYENGGWARLKLGERQENDYCAHFFCPAQNKVVQQWMD